MSRRIFPILCALCFVLCLTACGGENSEQLTALERENTQLQQQLSALEEEKAALEEEKAALEEQLGAQANQPETQPDAQEEGDNPIDPLYDAVETDGTTVALGAVADCRANAWQAEAEHLARQLKEQLPLEEDRQLVDAYLAAAGEQVERMNVMALYPISDLTLSQQDRVMSSGTLRGVLWAGGRARVWRDTFQQLRCVIPDGAYTFAFDPAAAQAELEELLQAG